MDNQQKLVSYISDQIQQGQTPDEIADQLSKANWPQEQIRQAFLTVQAQTLPTHMQSEPVVAQNTTPPPQANGKRRGRIRLGWRLLKHCLKLLKGNTYLLRYYLMTWVFIILINATICVLFWFVSPGFWDSNTHWYGLVFISYLVAYCVVNFYAAALARNILDIYKGEKQAYAVYIKAARARFWPIFIYSLISSVIGVILQYIIEKLGWIGDLIAWLVGTTWSLATMFTLPIIMDTPSSAPTAIKQSWGMFKQTWGEGITAKVSAGAPIGMLQVLLAFVFFILLFGGSFAGSAALVIGLIFVYIFLSVTLAVIGSYASNFINAALYYYAVNHQVPPGFEADMLNQVFIKSKRQLKKEAHANS